MGSDREYHSRVFFKTRVARYENSYILISYRIDILPLLAVLFEDAVILGIGTDNVSNAFSPVFSSRSSNLFSYYSLERTVSSLF